MKERGFSCVREVIWTKKKQFLSYKYYCQQCLVSGGGTAGRTCTNTVVPTDYHFCRSKNHRPAPVRWLCGRSLFACVFVVDVEGGHLLDQLSCVLSRIQPLWLTTVNYLWLFWIKETLPCWYIPYLIWLHAPVNSYHSFYPNNYKGRYFYTI